MNGRIFFWSLTSALAGFLFGFDTVVISGAEKTIQALWGLSPDLHGVAMGSALYGTVIGSLIGGWPADRWGRKATLLWIGVLYLVGAVGSALAASASRPSSLPCISRRSLPRHSADASPACSSSISSLASS
jgi:MFS transporter, SP family, arabinose:H+ symporter